MDKSPDAFRTISEVAVDLDLPQHVLRFWESRFAQIKPLKRGGGRRYYRPDDVELLKGIRHLLYGEGYTIRGVQRILKEQGVRFVTEVWRDGAPQPAKLSVVSSSVEEDDDATAYAGAEDTAEAFVDDGLVDDNHDEIFAARFDGARPESPASERSAASIAERFAPQQPVGNRPRPTDANHGNPGRASSHAGAVSISDDVHPGRSAIGNLIDRFRGAPTVEPEAFAMVRSNPSLSRDDVRRLQSVLFELLECKRLLDQVR
jgi:DNA-binding transcriptional MerR regulator